MYFETGQGSALSAEAHHGVDQLTLEARAYGVARTFDPFLVNSVVGFIGPEYLYDERQIIRAGLEDHFTRRILLPPSINRVELPCCFSFPWRQAVPPNPSMRTSSVPNRIRRWAEDDCKDRSTGCNPV